MPTLWRLLDSVPLCRKVECGFVRHIVFFSSVSVTRSLPWVIFLILSFASKVMYFVVQVSLISLWFLFLDKSCMNAYFLLKSIKFFFTCLWIFFSQWIGSFSHPTLGMWSYPSSNDAIRESGMHLVAEFMSLLGARIMWLDASSELEEKVIPFFLPD